MATLTSPLWSLTLFFMHRRVIYVEDCIAVGAFNFYLVIFLLIDWVHFLTLPEVFPWMLDSAYRIWAFFVLLERSPHTGFTGVGVTSNATLIDRQRDAAANHAFKSGECLSDSRVKRQFQLRLIKIGNGEFG